MTQTDDSVTVQVSRPPTAAVQAAVVAGVAGQPVFPVAHELAGRSLSAGFAVGLSGNPDARPGRAIEAHLRVSRSSRQPGPLTGHGECRIVLGLEPIEAIRAATTYYVPGLRVVSLTEPITIAAVAAGKAAPVDIDRAAVVLRETGCQVEWISGGVSDTSLSELVDAAWAVLSSMP